MNQCKQSKGVVTLKGQRSCYLPVQKGLNTISIRVIFGKLRLNHCSYTPDGGTWKCISCGRCAACRPSGSLSMIGQALSVKEAMTEVLRDLPFYTTGGVTFSGGECTSQPDFLFAMLDEAKTHGLNTAVEACGEAPWIVFEKLLATTDLFLYDIKQIN